MRAACLLLKSVGMTLALDLQFAALYRCPPEGAVAQLSASKLRIREQNLA